MCLGKQKTEDDTGNGASEAKENMTAGKVAAKDYSNTLAKECEEKDDRSYSDQLSAWLSAHSEILKNPWSELDENDSDEDSGGEKVWTDPTAGRDYDAGVTWSGKLSEDGCYEGAGTLTWENGDTFQGMFSSGVRNGWGIVTSREKDIQSLTGTWTHGFLEGKGRLVTFDTTVWEGWSRKSSFHGHVRRIVMKKFRTFRQQVNWLGSYKNGLPTGQCWEWWEGGGYLTGVVSADGSFTGDNVAFLYPDLYTALVGKFSQGVMASAQPAILTGLTITDDIAIPTFTQISGSAVSYCKSSLTSVGENPLTEDPYEARTCKVEMSKVEGSGEGLYARRDIKAGEIVAFYNGVRLPYIPGEKEDWDTSGYKIFVNADWKSGERIDLPGDLIYTKNYSATLGHKMNHTFEPNCTEWFFKHPRHDLIPCAQARVDIPKGGELYLHYGYDPLSCPAWYREALDAYLAEHPDLDMWQVSDPEHMIQLRIAGGKG